MIMQGEVIQSALHFKPQTETIPHRRQVFDLGREIGLSPHPMALPTLAILGGIWLSLLYSAMVVPATVWTIQLTVSRGWMSGLATAALFAVGALLGQLAWSLHFVILAGLALVCLAPVLVK